MMPDFWLSLNAVLGGFVVTVGLWLLVGDFSVTMAVLLVLGTAAVMAWRCPTITHVWAVATLMLGLESLAWPVLEMAAAKKLGPSPPLEALQHLFTAVLFGLFSGVFWLTFSYGLYKRIRASGADVEVRHDAGTPPIKKKGKKRRNQ